MTKNVAHILAEANRLSASEKAELAEEFVFRLGTELQPDISDSHLTEIRRRIQQVDSESLQMIPGEAALSRVRTLILSAPLPD